MINTKLIIDYLERETNETEGEPSIEARSTQKLPVITNTKPPELQPLRWGLKPF